MNAAPNDPKEKVKSGRFSEAIKGLSLGNKKKHKVNFIGLEEEPEEFGIVIDAEAVGKNSEGISSRGSSVHRQIKNSSS